MKKILTVNSESRRVNFELYNQFKTFSPHLFGSTQFQPDIAEFSNCKYIPLSYQPYFIADPLQLVSSHPNNLSWRTLKNLDSTLEGSSIVGITDTYYFWNHQVIRFAKKQNLPVYTVIWCNIPNHPSSWVPPYSWITKQVIDNTTLFILRNHQALQFTNSLKIPKEKIAVIYPGINVNKFKPKSTSKSNEKVKILYVGSLTKAKGVDLLIKAFSQIQKSTSTELHIAGSGPLEKYIKKASRELPVIYHGSIPYQELPLLYQNADIFCSPSRTQKLAGIPWWHEYFSYTLLEAQASGLPIIATRSGGIPEEVDSQNILISENSLDELVKALTSLVRDNDRRKALQNINRDRAENFFDISKQASLLEDQLTRIL